MEISALHSLFSASSGVTTDTRAINAGCIFFALKGERFNGNTFAQEALSQGAAYAVIDEPQGDDERFILCDDVLTCLKELATYHRDELDIPLIGITGSNGKTTTKELMRDVLASKYNVLATKGNLNNHIGVPLTLLSITAEHDMAIIEMGANHVGEIEMLSAIAKPLYGLITNIGRAHIGEFGGYHKIIQGKTELYAHLAAVNGIAFVREEDELLMEKSAQLDRSLYGAQEQSLFPLSIKSADPYLTMAYGMQEIATQMIGDYNLPNYQAAAAMGAFFDIAEQDIIDALAAYIPDNNRSQMIERAGARIIMDAYNANPSSMILAVENHQAMQATRHIAILGDMLELGDDSPGEHRKIMDAVGNDVSAIYIGAEFCAVAKSGETTFADAESAREHVAQLDIEDSLILIKGSRGIGLEKLLEVL